MPAAPVDNFPASLLVVPFDELERHTESKEALPNVGWLSVNQSDGLGCGRASIGQNYLPIRLSPLGHLHQAQKASEVAAVLLAELQKGWVVD
jgi:hypothetical protein